MNNLLKKEYNDLFDKYNSALKQAIVKIEELKKQLEKSEDNAIIAQISSRIKSPISIEDKLKHRSKEINIQNVTELKDIVGIRIVCYFRNDLDKIIKTIKLNFPNCIEKNYVDTPKENGYSSYHIITYVPVRNYLNNIDEYIPIEIQVRTLAMDLWASLDHKTNYKKGHNFSEETIEKIKAASVETTNFDKEVEAIIEELNKKTHKVISADSLFYDLNVAGKITDSMLFKYNSALNKLTTDINILDKSYENFGGITPIEQIIPRLKTPKSIFKKLTSKNLEVTEENMENELDDIVGIKIVCSFLNDLPRVLYDIKQILGTDEQGNSNILEETNYISKPKENGYSAYHINCKVPIYLNGKTKYIKAEIQILTKAMNLWACLEHKLCYHKKTTSEIKDTLKKYAIKLRKIDYDFNEVNMKIIEQQETSSQENTNLPKKEEYLEEIPAKLKVKTLSRTLPKIHV